MWNFKFWILTIFWRTNLSTLNTHCQNPRPAPVCDGGEEAAEDRLIAYVPHRVLRVGNLARDLVITSSGDFLNGGGRSFGSTGDVGKKVGMATEVGDHLSSPQHVVGMVQAHGD